MACNLRNTVRKAVTSTVRLALLASYAKRLQCSEHSEHA